MQSTWMVAIVLLLCWFGKDCFVHGMPSACLYLPTRRRRRKRTTKYYSISENIVIPLVCSGNHLFNEDKRNLCCIFQVVWKMLKDSRCGFGCR